LGLTVWAFILLCATGSIDIPPLEFRTVQAEIRTPALFLERTDNLARKLGVPLRELGPALQRVAPAAGLSTATIFNARKQGATISSKTWAKLERAETAVGLRSPPEGHHLPESEQHDYRLSGSAPASRLSDAAQNVGGMVAHSSHPFRPVPSKREDVEAYLRRYLDAAERAGDPDLFPAIMRQLKKQFPLEEFESKDRE
jgi:hypothetical protein